MTEEHKARWAAFIAMHNPEMAVAIAEDQREAMFRHGWKNADRNEEEYYAALVEWQQQEMERGPRS